MSSGDDSSQLPGGWSYPTNWLPALTPPADVDLEQGGQGERCWLAGTGRCTGHMGVQGRVRNKDCAFVELILLEANAISVLMGIFLCRVLSWG